jgi:hypothetical protein
MSEELQKALSKALLEILLNPPYSKLKTDEIFKVILLVTKSFCLLRGRKIAPFKKPDPIKKS